MPRYELVRFAVSVCAVYIVTNAQRSRHDHPDEVVKDALVHVLKDNAGISVRTKFAAA